MANDISKVFDRVSLATNLHFMQFLVKYSSLFLQLFVIDMDRSAFDERSL